MRFRKTFAFAGARISPWIFLICLAALFTAAPAAFGAENIGRLESETQGLLDAGKAEEALKMAVDALELDLPKARVLELVGKSYASLGETIQAIRAFGEAANLEPEWEEPYEQTLNFCMSELQNDVSLPDSGESESDADDQVVCWEALVAVSGELLFLNPANRLAGAVKQLIDDMTAVPVCPTEQAAVDFLQSGEKDYEEGHFMSATADYEEAIKIEPNCARLYKYLGDSNYAREDLSAAALAYMNAVEKTPDYSSVWLQLAKIHYELRNPFESMNYLMEAIRLQPNNPVAWDLYRLNGNMLGRNLGRYIPDMRVQIKAIPGGELSIRYHEPWFRDHPEKEPLRKAWRSYAAARSVWITRLYDLQYPENDGYRLTFEELFQAWSDLLRDYRDIAKSDPEARDADLEWLSGAESEGYLDAFIFYCAYDRDLKEEFDRWRVENPEKSTEFAQRYLLQERK